MERLREKVGIVVPHFITRENPRTGEAGKAKGMQQNATERCVGLIVEGVVLGGVTGEGETPSPVPLPKLDESSLSNQAHLVGISFL